MAKDSGISWTHHTFNPVWGCQIVSEGCRNCYAMQFAQRTGHPGLWGPAKTTPRRTFGDAHWNEPLAWDRAARKANVRERVFCGSMCDWAEDHPTVNDARPRLWELIRATPNLDWLLLSKRADRIAYCLPADWGHGYPNVWLGTSIEDMRVAWRLDALHRNPAVVRFVSYEPALGPLDGLQVEDVRKADWWIYGGESGAGYRADSDDWAFDIQRKVGAAGGAFYYKQTSAPQSGQRAILGGVSFQAYPVPRRVPLPASYRADQGVLL